MDDAVGVAVGVAVRVAVGVAVDVAVRGAVRDAVRGAVGDAVGVAVGVAVRGAVGDAVRGAVRDAVDVAVDGAVGVAVGDAVGGAVDVAVGDAVGDAVDVAVDVAVGDAVGDAVRGAVRGAVDVAVGDAVGDAVRGAVRGAVGGGRRPGIWRPSWRDGWWSGWTAYVEAMRQILGVEIPASFDSTYSAIAESSFWVPLQGVCLVSERHTTEVRKDADGRLHCEDGPAIAWADGWGVWSWHGTQVPAEWIEHKDRLDPRTALTHANVEMRRAAAEIVGWSRVLACVSARVVDKDADPQIGELLEADLPDSEGARFLRVRCATGREFVLSVPATCKTALEANAWTFGLDADELRLEVRT
jgi:hypothetical protein